MTDDPTTATAQVSALVDAHVREIVAAAEQAAIELQDEIEAEATRRAAALIAQAEDDAEQIRVAAEKDAYDHIEQAREQAAEFADGRIERLHELSDDLIARGEAIQSRLPEVEQLRSSLDDLVAALTSAAHLAAAEASRPAVRIPEMERATPRAPSPAPAAREQEEDDDLADLRPGGSVRADDAPAPARAAGIVSDPRAAGPPSVALAKDAEQDQTAGAIREAASELPRVPRRPYPTRPPAPPEDRPA